MGPSRQWPRLATLPVSLSPLVQKNLDDLWIAVRALQEKLAETAPARSDYRADLSKYTSQIENSRSGRSGDFVDSGMMAMITHQLHD